MRPLSFPLTTALAVKLVLLHSAAVSATPPIGGESSGVFNRLSSVLSFGRHDSPTRHSVEAEHGPAWLYDPSAAHGSPYVPQTTRLPMLPSPRRPGTPRFGSAAWEEHSPLFMTPSSSPLPSHLHGGEVELQGFRRDRRTPSRLSSTSIEIHPAAPDHTRLEPHTEAAPDAPLGDVKEGKTGARKYAKHITATTIGLGVAGGAVASTVVCQKHHAGAKSGYCKYFQA